MCCGKQGKDINRAKRSSLSDENFNMFMFMKRNMLQNLIFSCALQIYTAAGLLVRRSYVKGLQRQEEEVERNLPAVWLHQVLAGRTDAAKCIHCSTVLANCSLKPAKLSHHQSNLHPNIELTEEDLEAKRKRFDKKGFTLPTYGFQPESKPMVQASFEVA
ncbi:hypothetical protein GWK47_024767 [Chionoecetes opilio]|uniref:Uncharacterized protein n=1 Tax=Chionoecetes opilio TaxID=41210 RepID=A0A8J4XLL0_CHIOP|nr:hypothetical protein GWK47_024767 [Chionoecetes opilio]